MSLKGKILDLEPFYAHFGAFRGTYHPFWWIFGPYCGLMISEIVATDHAKVGEPRRVAKLTTGAAEVVADRAGAAQLPLRFGGQVLALMVGA